jgi:hypothetical protein
VKPEDAEEFTQTGRRRRVSARRWWSFWRWRRRVRRHVRVEYVETEHDGRHVVIPALRWKP